MALQGRQLKAALGSIYCDCFADVLQPRTVEERQDINMKLDMYVYSLYDYIYIAIYVYTLFNAWLGCTYTVYRCKLRMKPKPLTHDLVLIAYSRKPRTAQCNSMNDRNLDPRRGFMYVFTIVCIMYFLDAKCLLFQRWQMQHGSVSFSFGLRSSTLLVCRHDSVENASPQGNENHRKTTHGNEERFVGRAERLRR